MMRTMEYASTKRCGKTAAGIGSGRNSGSGKGDASVDRQDKSSAGVADQKNKKDCDGGDPHVIPASSRFSGRSPASSDNGFATASDNEGPLE